MSGMEWIPYAASAAATAVGGAYASNQANSTAAGNAWTANMVNMASQVQNQGYNSAEALKAREFNSEEAQRNRQFQDAQGVTTRQFNADEAQRNREFQEHMSNTSYQRSVEDMKAAGLNPMLTYAKGGASTPNGSSASGQAMSGSMASGPAASSGSGPGANVAQVRPVNFDLATAMSSALDMGAKEAVIKKTNAEADYINAQTNTTVQSFKEQLYSFEERMRSLQLGVAEKNLDYRVKVELEEVRKDVAKLEKQKREGEIGELQASIRLKNAMARLDELGVPAAANAAEYATKTGVLDNALKSIGSAAGSAASVSRIAR